MPETKIVFNLLNHVPGRPAIVDLSTKFRSVLCIAASALYVQIRSWLELNCMESFWLHGLCKLETCRYFQCDGFGRRQLYRYKILMNKNRSVCMNGPIFSLSLSKVSPQERRLYNCIIAWELSCPASKPRSMRNESLWCITCVNWMLNVWII